MAQQQRDKQGNPVKFIRVRGKVIPIRAKPGESGGGARGKALNKVRKTASNVGRSVSKIESNKKSERRKTRRGGIAGAAFSIKGSSSFKANLGRSAVGFALGSVAMNVIRRKKRKTKSKQLSSNLKSSVSKARGAEKAARGAGINQEKIRNVGRAHFSASLRDSNAIAKIRR